MGGRACDRHGNKHVACCVFSDTEKCSDASPGPQRFPSTLLEAASTSTPQEIHQSPKPHVACCVFSDTEKCSDATQGGCINKHPSTNPLMHALINK